jgi:hypothetical protein
MWFIQPASATPKLAELAHHCHNGAVNTYALIKSFGERITEVPMEVATKHPAVKVIIGQLSYLLKESAGPTPETIQDYELWLDWSRLPKPLLTFEQERAIAEVKRRWKEVGQPLEMLGCDGAVSVPVTGESGVTMYLAIERDGYTHS